MNEKYKSINHGLNYQPRDIFIASQIIMIKHLPTLIKESNFSFSFELLIFFYLIFNFFNAHTKF